MRRLLLAGACGLLGLLASCAGAQLPAVMVDADGVAANGYDVVAYFDGRVSKGSKAHEVAYDDSLWHFESAQSADKFAADPARYAPEFGGYCAYGVSQGYLVATDPQAWTVADGRLYLNFNIPTRRHWLTKHEEFIDIANEQWPDLAGLE